MANFASGYYVRLCICSQSVTNNFRTN